MQAGAGRRTTRDRRTGPHPRQAIHWGVAGSNPLCGFERGGKRRKVEMEEVRRLWALAGERMRVAINRAVSTGQRRGDLLTLKPDHLTDDGIAFRQSNTGAGVPIATKRHHLQGLTRSLRAIATAARRRRTRLVCLSGVRIFAARNGTGRAAVLSEF